MSTQSTFPVEAVVTVSLFTDEDSEAAGLIDIEGQWPADTALRRALVLVCQYLARHVGNSAGDPGLEA
jgi:hypothetical protein